MADFTPQEIEQFLQQFFDTVGARQYTGARYVPIFGRVGEDTVEWDDLSPYEPLTVVMHQGVSYVSRRYVPAGIPITDTGYWVETYRFNAQVEQYRQEVMDYAREVDGAYAYIDGKVADLAETVGRERVPYPTAPLPHDGEDGQVLSTIGNGRTKWIDQNIPTQAEVNTAVDAWFEAHPDAYVAVNDNSVSDQKLVQEYGILDKQRTQSQIFSDKTVLKGSRRGPTSAGNGYKLSYNGIPTADPDYLLLIYELRPTDDVIYVVTPQGMDFRTSGSATGSIMKYMGAYSGLVKVPEAATYVAICAPIATSASYGIFSYTDRLDGVDTQITALQTTDATLRQNIDYLEYEKANPAAVYGYLDLTRTSQVYDYSKNFVNSYYILTSGEITEGNRFCYSVIVKDLPAGRYVARREDIPTDVLGAMTTLKIGCRAAGIVVGESVDVQGGAIIDRTQRLSYAALTLAEPSDVLVVTMFDNEPDALTRYKYADEFFSRLYLGPVPSGYEHDWEPYYTATANKAELATFTDVYLNLNSDRSKTLWWCGTSIPAGADESQGAPSTGLTYPDRVGEILGATVINQALGSSMARANVRTGDYVGALSYNIIYSLSQTVAEKEYLITNWSTIRQSLRDPDSFVTLDAVQAAVRNASFERRLMPYLNGTYDMPDVFVFDHGHNDYKGYYTLPDSTPDIALQPTPQNIADSILAEDTHMTAGSYAGLIGFFGEVDHIPAAQLQNFVASVNRNCFIGAINFLVTLILSRNPHARIVFIGNYDAWEMQNLTAAQDAIATSWEFPIVRMWERLGYSNHYIPNTYDFWDPAATGSDLIMKNVYCRDNVHPHTDTTGTTIELYAQNIAAEIRRLW